MIDDAIELLTKIKIQQSIRDHKKGTETTMILSKVDLIGVCIKVLKVIKENEDEKR